MPGRPLVLLGICCAATAALGPTLVLDTGPAAPRAAVAVARSGPAHVTASPHEVVDAPWVVHPAVRPLLPDVDVLLVRDAAAQPGSEALVARTTAAAAAVGRALRTVAPPTSGLVGLQAAVRAAGPPPAGGRVVLWLPPCDDRGADEQHVVAGLVSAGARVVAVHAPDGCRAGGTATRTAAATGGAVVDPDDLTRPGGALSAATVQLRLEPVCEPGLSAVPDPAPRSTLSGTPAGGRWSVRVERDAPDDAVLSCVLLPHVDGAPALDAVRALTVRVSGGGARRTPPRPSAPPDPALLEDVGERLLDVRRQQAQLRDAVRRGAPDEPVEAVLRALADRERELADRREALGQALPDDPAPPDDHAPPDDPGPAPAPPLPVPGAAGLTSADSARKAVAYALAQLGEPYVWGATGPSTFDCSGLTSTAYASAGVRIPRVSRDQFHAGVPVRRADLLPGDLVFFARDPADPRTVHHVAMALGAGRMVHAPQTGDVVRVVPLRTRGWAGAVRIIGAVAAPAGPVAVTLPTVVQPSVEDGGARVRRGPVLPGAVSPPANPPRPGGPPTARPGGVPGGPAPADTGHGPPPRAVVPPVVGPPAPGAPPPGAAPPGEAPPAGPGPGPTRVPPRRPQLPPAVEPRVDPRPPVVVPTRPPGLRPPVVRPPVVRPPLLPPAPPPVVRPPVLPPVARPPVLPPVLPPVVPPPADLRPPVVPPPAVLPPVVRPAPRVLPPVVRPPLEPPVVRLPVVPLPLPRLDPGVLLQR